MRRDENPKMNKLNKTECSVLFILINAKLNTRNYERKH